MSTKTSELEYCETCGTMLVMGNCRRCNPVTKRSVKTKVVKPMKVPKTEVHKIGVDYVIEKLINQGISTISSDETGIDLILDNGKTILVRAMSNEDRLAVKKDTFDLFNADYLIIASNLNFTSIRKIYIMTSEAAENIAENKPEIITDRNNYFINRNKYIRYVNNYVILNE